MSNELENTGKILIYQNEKGDTKIDVYFEGDTIWMTQKSMCDLYQVAKSSISEHIRCKVLFYALIYGLFCNTSGGKLYNCKIVFHFLPPACSLISCSNLFLCIKYANVSCPFPNVRSISSHITILSIGGFNSIVNSASVIYSVNT